MSDPAPSRQDRTEMPVDAPALCVLSVAPLLEVTVETLGHQDEPHVHVHAGGQGLWVARMAKTLGAGSLIGCSPPSSGRSAFGSPP